MIPSHWVDSLTELEQRLMEMTQDVRIHSAMLLMAEQGHPSAEALNPILQSFSKPLVGGVFPEVIFQGHRKTTGMVILPLDFALHTAVIDLSLSENEMLEHLIAVMPPLTAPYNHLMLFVDAFAGAKGLFVDVLFNYFGNAVTVLGGGAGSLSFNQMPCVLTNQGLFDNAAVLGLGAIKANIGVAHGWTSISKPMKVTQAEGSKVISIDWQPAFEVYRQIVEPHAGCLFNDTNFFEIAKSYPLGMLKLDEEHVVRDPIKTDGTALYIVDVVEQGQFINIMHGDEVSLVGAALKARQKVDGQQQSESTEKRSFFCIDCISRVLFMQDNFSKELAILKGHTTVNGALTIGEIANNGDSFLEIFNKTVVLAKWEPTI